MPAAGASLAAPRRLVPRLRSGSWLDHHHHDQGGTHTNSSGATEPSAPPHPSRRRHSFSGFRGVSNPLPPLLTARKLRFLHRWSCFCCCAQVRHPASLREQCACASEAPRTPPSVLIDELQSVRESRHRRRVSVLCSSWRGSRWFHLAATRFHNPARA